MVVELIAERKNTSGVQDLPELPETQAFVDVLFSKPPPLDSKYAAKDLILPHLDVLAFHDVCRGLDRNIQTSLYYKVGLFTQQEAVEKFGHDPDMIVAPTYLNESKLPKVAVWRLGSVIRDENLT